MIHDPKALHTVMVKDQEFYTNSIAPSKYVIHVFVVPSWDVDE